MRAIAEDLLALVARCTPLLLAVPAAAAAVRPAPGKWSRREILGHLIDSAGNNQQKFVRLQTGGGALAFVGYAQDAWVAAQRYQDADWGQLVRWWQAANEHLAHVIAHIDPAHHGHTITLDGHGPFRLDFIVPDYVEHQKHHLRAALPDADITSAFRNLYGA
ncbi:MAG: DinB family protein [Planctomycetota bacterium]